MSPTGLAVVTTLLEAAVGTAAMLVMAVAVTTIAGNYRELHVCQGLNPGPSPQTQTLTP